MGSRLGRLTPSGRRRRREAQERLRERARKERERYRSVDVERRLGAELQTLPSEARIAFAAASAERLFPAYELFSREDEWGDPSVLRGILDAVWTAAEGRGLSNPASAMRALAEELAPDHSGEVAWTSEWSSLALDAVVAIVRAAETAEDPSVGEVAGIAEYEVEGALGLCDDDVGDPLVRETLQLMADDIADLRAGRLARVRARASREGLPERARRAG